MSTIDAQLYWLMPGPRSFVASVAARLSHSRLIAINMPYVIVPGTWDRIRQGLKDGFVDDVVELAVRSGTDIATDVGFHFGGARLTAQALAAVSITKRRAVLLKAEDAAAHGLCRQYGYDFMKASGYAGGNVRLVISLHDGVFENESDHSIQIISFDGGLTADEMDAYVGLRMIGRSGPGTTRLTKAIVSEFAGFDAVFAERLMELDESKTLALRDQLEAIESEQPDRWRLGTWEDGARSKLRIGDAHVLHDAYLLRSGTTQQKEAANERINRRYWRACVKVLTPWLEERRREVVMRLHKQIEQHAAHNAGKILVPRGNGRTISIDPEELEYNNIVGMANEGILLPTTQEDARAISVCRTVKRVRDAIAHLRAPDSNDIATMIREMDLLLNWQPTNL